MLLLYSKVYPRLDASVCFYFESDKFKQHDSSQRYPIDNMYLYNLTFITCSKAF